VEKKPEKKIVPRFLPFAAFAVRLSIFCGHRVALTLFPPSHFR